MTTEFVANAEILIEAPVLKVWDAFVNPEIIKKYMFGTNVKTDWKKGSKIIWEGEWEGQKYKENGEILEIKKPEILKYSYFSSISQKEDKPENYKKIIVNLTNYGDNTNVRITQDNNVSMEERDRSKQSWQAVLDNLKALLEATN